jgi:hypothetical protein
MRSKIRIRNRVKRGIRIRSDVMRIRNLDWRKTRRVLQPLNLIFLLLPFCYSSAVCSNCLSDCLVEQVAVLLHRIMADNPKLASLYTTGVFFFILMYTGSNLLPIGRFLAMSHDKQAFRSQSILLPFLFVHFGNFSVGRVSFG